MALSKIKRKIEESHHVNNFQNCKNWPESFRLRRNNHCKMKMAMVKTALWKKKCVIDWNWHNYLIFLPKFRSVESDLGQLDLVEITIQKENTDW